MLAGSSEIPKPLKLLDIMLLSTDCERKPQKWLFTDTQGFFSCQDIATMSLDDLIKAILGNIEGTSTPLGHTEILVR